MCQPPFSRTHSDQCYTLNSCEIHSSPVTPPLQCPLSSPPAWIPAVASKPCLLFCSSENQKRSFRRRSLTKTTPCLIRILQFPLCLRGNSGRRFKSSAPFSSPTPFPSKAVWSAFACLTLLPPWCSQKPLSLPLSLHLSYPTLTCLSSPTRQTVKPYVAFPRFTTGPSTQYLPQ